MLAWDKNGRKTEINFHFLWYQTNWEVSITSDSLLQGLAASLVLLWMLFFMLRLTDLRCLLDSLTSSTADSNYFCHLGWPCLHIVYNGNTSLEQFFYLLIILDFQRNVLESSNVTICRDKQMETSHTNVAKRVHLNSWLEI